MQDTTHRDIPTGVTLEIASELEAWRTRVLNVMLAVVFIAATLAMVPIIAGAITDPQEWTASLILLAAYLFLGALAFLRRLDLRLRAWTLMLLCYAVGALAFARGGLAGDGPLYLLALPVMAMILIGVRSGLVMAILSLLTFAAFAVAAHLGWLEGWLVILDNPLTLLYWGGKGTVFAMLLLTVVVLLWFSNRSQTHALQTSRERAIELGQAHALLQERAEELDRRAHQLATLNRIGRHVASILDRQELLQHAVDAVREDLGYLQAAVFLVDEEVNALYVAAATDNFWEIIPDGYRQPVGKGAIGTAVQTEETVLVSDAASDPRVYRVGKWLSPSSLSAPIKVGRRVVGVLEVESNVPDAFDENDRVTLEMMADQIAIAIENARLFSDTQASLRELDALYRQYAAESWRQYTRARPETVRYSYGSVTCPAQTWQAAREQARASGEAVTFTGDDGSEGAIQSLAVPVGLRGLAVGVLGFHRPAETGAWQPEEIAMVRMVADRLALALENARLLEEAQRRAYEEHLLGEVTARMRETLDVETVLKTAVQEVRRALELPEVIVRLVSQSPDQTQDVSSQYSGAIVP